jgi:hypothetical protein
MTYLGNNVYKWTYSGEGKIADGSMIIFSNAGNNQSSKDGVKFVNGGYYDLNGYVKTIEGAGEIPDDPIIPTDPTTYTAFFDNSSANWSDVKAWVWDQNNNKNYTGGTWPGQSIALDPETGYYRFTCTVTDANPKMMIIFNDGNGTQTADAEFVNGGIYNASGFTGKVDYTTVVNVTDANALNVWAASGRLYVETPDATMIQIARADGSSQIVSLHVGRNEIELPHGFYIVAGKKVIL